MAKETFTGPLIALGGMAGGLQIATPAGYGGVNAGGTKEYSDEIGPSIFWGGIAIPATGAVVSKDRTGPGSIPSVFCAFPIRTINAAIVAGNAALTTATNPTAGTALPNITTYAAGRAVGVPVVGSGGIATTGIALDMGLDPATFAVSGGVAYNNLVTGTATLTTIANAWRYRIGQWICLLNCPTNSTQMTQITSINATTGVLSVYPPCAGATTGQIALSNRYNLNTYGASQTIPTSVSSMAGAGTARIVIPEVGNTRGLGITGVAASAPAGGTFTIVGVGAFGGLQTETLAAPTGATTTWSKKTYDMFISATPNFSEVATHNYTVVTSDFIGFPISVMDAGSIITVTNGGTTLTPGTNYTLIPADLTNPPTTTTGDPRGGIQTTANGPGATPGTPSVFTGGVVTVDQRLNPLQVALSTTINPGPLLGVATV